MRISLLLFLKQKKKTSGTALVPYANLPTSSSLRLQMS